MLQKISSARFIETTILVTAVYYLVVMLLFYRGEIKRLLTNTLFRRPSPRGKGETPM